MKNKIIILRGKPTAGNSTAYSNLKKDIRMKKCLFIDHCKLKKELGKDEGKEKLFLEIKNNLVSGKNIIIEEMPRENLEKNLRNEIEKNDYEIVVFQFNISKEEAYLRDVDRGNKGTHPTMGREWIDKMHKMHEEKEDRKAIVIDCDSLDKEEVSEKIIEVIKK